MGMRILNLSLSPRHPNKPCHIVMIVKIWKSEDSNDYVRTIGWTLGWLCCTDSLSPHSPLPTPHSTLPTPHSTLPTPHSHQWFCGTWFFRPEETFHVATRKFYEKVRMVSVFLSCHGDSCFSCSSAYGPVIMILGCIDPVVMVMDLLILVSW